MIKACVRLRSMENDEPNGKYSGGVKISVDEDYLSSNTAINSSILDYYKKFGRKRDLEQFFSLSTAQSEIRDRSSLFWRRIKAMSDSSSSGDKKSESPTELCRISIKCSMLDEEPYEPQVKKKGKSESPPIITEDVQEETSKHSDNESVKSDDNASQISMDATLDTSVNKLLSPTSSVTSQRKLEWDSLADVGYANESDRKNSATSLSTLERLALKQQYSNESQNANIGIPTAQSTPLDENDNKNKGRTTSKTTKVYRKDSEYVQFNLPHTSDTNTPAINVNLTKHISFSVDKDHVDITSKSVSMPQPNPISETVDTASQIKMDKEIQTTLLRESTEKSSCSAEMPKSVVPVLINLNALRRRQRKKKVHHKKSSTRIKRKEGNKENVPVLEKSGEQVSDAESFEYMPGHIYNQKQMKKLDSKTKTNAGNKSSLESSGNFTTDSSKGSKHSFTKDFQKSLNLLKSTLDKRYDDTNIKKKLVKEVVQRLLKSSYRDDESTTDFLSGLSYGSVKLGLSEATTTTTSTSEANTTEKQPKKSILRHEKFNSNMMASTSQSAPNLPSVSNSEMPITTSLKKRLMTSNTDSDTSSKGKMTDTALTKTSSEELYQKYLEALKKEQAYKKHLKDKEMFLRQKLVCSDTAIKMPVQVDPKTQTKLKELMKDLTRNNYDDGSGDASKLEGGHSQQLQEYGLRKPRSHSVFTLSSGDGQTSSRKNSPKGAAKDSSKAGPSHDEHYCCCPYHTEHEKVVGVTDSSVQVNIKNQLEETKKLCVCSKSTRPNVSHYVSDHTTGDIKYVCLCPENTGPEDGSEKILVYKCSRLLNKGFSIPEQAEKAWKAANETVSRASPSKEIEGKKRGRVIISRASNDNESKKISQSSQTNLAKLFDKSKKKSPGSSTKGSNADETTYIHEATRQLQTEISINPRISDPSLCDIKIIAKNDCAKLIMVQYRPVSKSSLEKASSENTVPEQHFPTGSEVSYGTSLSSGTRQRTQQRQMMTMTYTKNSADDGQSVSNSVRGPGNENIQDNLTIPIQGTNMTLMVKMGMNAQNQLNTNPDKYNNQQVNYNQALAIITNARQSAKSPSHVNTLFSNEIYHPRDYTPSEASKNLEKGVGVQNDLLDDFFATESQKLCECPNNNAASVSNTYPKVLPKPFLRTNTDNNLRVSQDSKMCQCGCFLSECECDKLCENEPQVPFSRTANTNTNNYDKPVLLDSKMCQCGYFLSDCQCDKLCETEPQQPLQRNISTEIFNDDYFFEPIESAPPQYPVLPPPSPVKPCPCPAPAECGNECDENADCYECADAPVTQAQESLNRKSPEPAKTSPKRTSIAHPIAKPDMSAKPVKTPFLAKPEPAKPTPCKKPDPNLPNDQWRTTKMQKCPCEKGAECGRRCEETAECWYPEMTDEIDEAGFNSKSMKKIAGRSSHRQSGSDDGPDDNEESSENDFGYLTNENPERESNMEPKTSSNKNAQPKTISSDQSSKKSSDIADSPGLDTPKDFIIQMINDITKRYKKKDIQKSKRKKCFNEIMKILNYLLETEDPDPDILKAIENATSGATDSEQDVKNKISCARKKTPETTAFSCAKPKPKSPTPSCSKPKSPPVCNPPKPEKTCADKCINVCTKKSKTYKGCCTESSDVPLSSECPCTSSEAPTCRVLDKIRKECEKYHQKRCKCKSKCKISKCETSSSTSVNCDKCKKIHHCHCRTHRCKSKSRVVVDRIKKKCVAYNLIIQTSESMISEQPSFEQGRRLQNIIVKVPPKRKLENMPFREAEARIERHLSSPRNLGRYQRSRSLPRESGLSSVDDDRNVNCYTVKEYLETNRPDFMQQASYRQNCLRMINENRNQAVCAPSRLKMVVVHHPNGNDPCAGCNQPVTMYCEGVPTLQCTCTDPYNMHMSRKTTEVTRIAKDRHIQRELLSMQLQLQQDDPQLTSLSESDLQQLARELGADMRRKQEAPKFISEREMKKHSEKIYKSLPEVVQKKDELKKERIKKTNLLMASIFNKNLQKKTLRGAVNLSNYSNVVKI